MFGISRIIREQVIYKIIDPIWGKIIMLISFPTIMSYTTYLTDSIKAYAPLSYCIAFCIGIIIALEVIKRARNLCVNTIITSAEIKLHSYGDTRIPDTSFNQNIWRWYILNILDAEKTVIQSIIFISFDKPILIGTLKVASPDMKLPVYEVKEYNNRFAVITFSGQLLSGTLVISS